MSSKLFFARSKIRLLLLRSEIRLFLLRSKKKLGRRSKDKLILLRAKKSWEVHIVKISLFYYVRKKAGK